MTKKLIMPFLNAGIVGLGETALTATVAAIRQNDVRSESLVTLLGGTITGAIAGLARCAIPEVDDSSSNWLLHATTALHCALNFGAALAAPVMGEACLKLGSDSAMAVADGIVGNVFTLSMLTALAVVTTTEHNSITSYTPFRFFSPRPRAEDNQAELALNNYGAV